MSALWPPALLLSRLQCLSLTFSALVSPQPPSAHSGRAPAHHCDFPQASSVRGAQNTTAELPWTTQLPGPPLPTSTCHTRPGALTLPWRPPWHSPSPGAARGQCQRPGGQFPSQSAPSSRGAPTGAVLALGTAGLLRDSLDPCLACLLSQRENRPKQLSTTPIYRRYSGRGDSKDMLMSPWNEFNVGAAPGCSEGQEEGRDLSVSSSLTAPRLPRAALAVPASLEASKARLDIPWSTLG